jgi:hypothetical protein
MCEQRTLRKIFFPFFLKLTGLANFSSRFRTPSPVTRCIFDSTKQQSPKEEQSKSINEATEMDSCKLNGMSQAVTHQRIFLTSENTTIIDIILAITIVLQNTLHYAAPLTEW